MTLLSTSGGGRVLGGPRGWLSGGQRRRGDCAETGVGRAATAEGYVYQVRSSSDRPDADGWGVSYNGAAPARTVEFL